MIELQRGKLIDFCCQDPTCQKSQSLQVTLFLGAQSWGPHSAFYICSCLSVNKVEIILQLENLSYNLYQFQLTKLPFLL